jgi:hypothetical protein
VGNSGVNSDEQNTIMNANRKDCASKVLDRNGDCNEN